MGAIFFFIFIGILFFIAVLFMIISAVCIIRWQLKKRRGDVPKKRWLVIPVCFLLISVLVALVPVGYIGFLRYANGTQAKEIVLAESGQVIYWPKGEVGPTTSWFEMEGIEYVRFREGFSQEPFFLAVTKEQCGPPVANIKYDPTDANGFNEFMTVLLAGKSTGKLYVSTVYPIANDNGFAFYQIEGTAGNGVYCPKEEIDTMKAYYADLENYDTAHLICDSAVYTDGEGLQKRHDTPYIQIKKEIAVRQGIFAELKEFQDSGQGKVRIQIPQKYSDLDEAAAPGTPIFGYEEQNLVAYSDDHLVVQEVNLALIGGQVYIKIGSDGDSIRGCLLSDELNQYIIDTIFKAGEN